jgi:heme A synthase
MLRMHLAISRMRPHALASPDAPPPPRPRRGRTARAARAFLRAGESRLPSAAVVTRITRFGRFAWALLAYDVAVAAWGAYVRATGSGAGCGRHWPLCNGQVIPQAPRIETLVELSHRLSSAAAVALTGALLVWAWRAYPRRHPVRRGAAAAGAFMVAEALIGAGLVLFQLVAHDASAKRALSVSLHLVNTFLLLGSTALTAWWASGGAPVRVRRQGAVAWSTALPLGAVLVVGVSGAVTALGDTLFPSSSIASGLAQDFSPGAHLLVRLRALHPVLAVVTAAAIVVATAVTRARRPTRAVRGLSRAAASLAVVQVGAGLLDIATLAPVWLQLGHLVLADAVWIALVLTSAAALADDVSAARLTGAVDPRSRRLGPPARAPQGLRVGLDEREGEA